jgi:6-pyruvoyltetrahydropterin/6-carboxytetrahydropterin synthase
MELTSRYRFSAAHRLDTPSLTPEQNRDIYGKCNNPFGHGHDYVLEITVDGSVDENGLIVNREQMDRMVRSAVIEKLDHKYLNQDVAEFAKRNPTTENLAFVIRDYLADAWTVAAKLVRVRIVETDRNTFVLEEAR